MISKEFLRKWVMIELKNTRDLLKDLLERAEEKDREKIRKLLKRIEKLEKELNSLPAL